MKGNPLRSLRYVHSCSRCQHAPFRRHAQGTWEPRAHNVLVLSISLRMNDACADLPFPADVLATENGPSASGRASLYCHSPTHGDEPKNASGLYPLYTPPAANSTAPAAASRSTSFAKSQLLYVGLFATSIAAATSAGLSSWPGRLAVLAPCLLAIGFSRARVLRAGGAVSARYAGTDGYSGTDGG